MVRETDLLVIGGGMAGTIAGITAAKSGLRPIMVRPGYGTTALSSGAVNLNGTVEWLRRVQGADKSYDELVEEVTSDFLEMMAQAGYPYAGSPHTSKQLINMLGTIKSTQFCPETMEPGDLVHLENANILFVGIQGLNDYDAHNVSQSVGFFSDTKLVDVQFKTGWIEIEFPSVKRSSNLSVFDLARLIDKEQVASELCQRIRNKVDLEQFTHVAFPPILGLEAPGMVLSVLQQQLGLPCFEILAIPPSVPGYRLQKALDRLMGRYGVEIIHGRVNGFESSERKINTVQAVNKTVHYEFKPQAVVLASGKFISGGIQWDTQLKEPIFDLPVCVNGTFDIPAGMGGLLADQYVADQKMYTAGLRVDENMHPVATDGRVIFDNLFAAGSVLTGYNYTQGDGGIGIPLLTGFISASVAAKQIAELGAAI